ncbi:MAG: FtsW/RodA/SpoVE family cell cycle protein [Eubacteriales bacterium]|nr:FtsW/RodA/SpoVE family cell cycle protein [Eubacteriales bacterium]
MEVISLPATYHSNRRGKARRRAVSRSTRKEESNPQRKNRKKQAYRQQTRRQAPRIPMTQGMAQERRRKVDAPLLLITIMLLIVGLISLLSASYPKGYYSTNIGPFYYFIRQLGMAIVGLVLMWIVSSIHYENYRKYAIWLYLISAVLLVLVLTPLGTTLNKSQRWLFGFQPSEIAKLAIIVVFAALASNQPESVFRLRTLMFYAALVAVYVGLLALEPHMSAAMIIVVIAFVILFVAGMHVGFLVPVGIAGVCVSIASYFLLGHVQARLRVFLDPFSDARGKGWQAVQSLIAIGSGGTFGLGLGQSRQKFLYLPEPMNDFIFSVICEELGFIGASLILILFAYLVYRGFSIARRAADRFGCLLATGITMQFAFQILLNLAVVSGLFPVTGASLPLFSYGGTALVMQLVEIGILLNISRHIPPSKQD